MKYLRYLTPKKFLLAITALLLFLVFFRLVDEWSFPDTTWEIHKDDKIKLKPGYPIEQKFIAIKDNLAKMEILFGKSNNIAPGGRMILQVLNETCSDEIRKSSIGFRTLDSDNTYKFIFPKIQDSKDKKYCLRLSFKPKKAETKSAEVFVIEKPPVLKTDLINRKYDKTDADKSTELKGKSLSLRPSYQNDSWRENIMELNQRISQYKPWFLKESYLFAIIFSFVIFSIITAILLLLL